MEALLNALWIRNSKSFYFTASTKVHDGFTPEEGWESFNRHPRQVVDVNGDGRADIIGFGGHTTYVALGKKDETSCPMRLLI